MKIFDIIYIVQRLLDWLRNFVNKHRLILGIVFATSFLFASSVADVHEHKDDKIHDNCPLCIFKISNNIESSGKPLPKLPKASLPKPVYIKPFFRIILLSIELRSRSPPFVS